MTKSDSARRRTSRGLRQIPSSRAEAAPAPREEPKPRRREVHHPLITRGASLDGPLLISILVLLAFGLVMLFSASFAYGYYYEDGNSYYYVLRQGGFAAVGVAAMLFISRIDYHKLHALAYPIHVGSIVLLLAVLLFGRVLHIESIAPSEGSAVRWLSLGPITFQPSEVTKFAVILICAHFISQHAEEMKRFAVGVLPFARWVIVPAVLIMAENHLSGTIIVVMLGLLLMFIGGTRVRWMAAIVALAAVAAVVYVVFMSSYQMDRVRIWMDPFNPELDRDLTHQTRQSLYAIGSGGFLGVGLGQSRLKYLYLPEPQNDFIFAIVCEELGFVGALIVIVLFSLLIWRGVFVSLRAKDRFGTLLGLGITFQVGLQAVLNICVVTNTIPNTGISLPFFSYGGTALLMLLAEMGVLLNISRSANIEMT